MTNTEFFSRPTNKLNHQGYNIRFENYFKQCQRHGKAHMKNRAAMFI